MVCDIMSKLKYGILFVIAALMSIIVAGCGGQTSDNKEVPSSSGNEEKIVIGFDDNFPPFGFKDEKGEIVGFDIELAKEAMHRMGREVEFKPIVWSNKEEELNSGNIDMIWNGLEISEERQQNMIFSKPYMSSGSIIFMYHTHNPSLIVGKEKLAGLTVGVQKDSTPEMYIKNDNYLKFTIKDLKLYDDSLEAFKDLENRSIDAVVCDEINGRYYIFKNNLRNKIDPLDIQISEGGKIAIGFRKSDVDLRNEVQKALDSMIEDGTARKISEQWFGKDLIMQN